MLKGVVSTVEKLFWAMVWVIGLMILAFWILGKTEDKFQGNIIGKFATWVNDRARPQAA